MRDAVGNKIIHPYSDFLLHDIGTGDGVPVLPGADFASTATQIRTCRYGRLRTRNRLMHDGLSFTLAGSNCGTPARRPRRGMLMTR